jgi:C-terminal processing protease CtpA/Prc
MIMPMQDAAMYCYGNVRLEANGVAPTIPIKDLLAYAEGVDTIKEAGIKVIYDMVKDNAPVKPEVAPDKKPADQTDEEEKFFVAARRSE